MTNWLRTSGSALGFLLILAGGAAAQTIALKTLPIATGEQFLIFPSKSLGMAGLSIAYDDPLEAPFANPARFGSEGTWFIASPLAYGANLDDVGGQTLPLTVVHGGKRWSGAFTAAMQQLDSPERQQWWWGQVEQDGVLLDDEAANTYLYGSLGRKLGDGRTSLGVSGYYAGLNALDGVGQLYANSASIEQSGSIQELRVGAERDLGGERRLEAIGGYSLLDMTHDVAYVNWRWDEVARTTIVNTRSEENRDRTSTWSGMLRYTAPLEGTGRFGVILVANTKAHPKIPNYEVVNIPRDPGNSTLFAAGVGFTSREGPSTFGAELFIQPGRSHTWAFADTLIPTPAGVLRVGDKTVDNQFRFLNWSVALGWEREWTATGVQLGLRMNRYGYSLDQHNYLAATYRETDESWIEWSPSWGGMVKLGRGELRYSGRFVAKGFDLPQLFGGGGRMELAAPVAGGDFLVAPTTAVSMPDFRVTAHRLMIVVPLSAKR